MVRFKFQYLKDLLKERDSVIYQDKRYMQFQAWHDGAEIITAGDMPLLFKDGKAYTPNNSYGGPLNSGFSYVQFINDLTRLGAKEYLIRFSPWMENHKYFPADKIEFSRYTVARDLREPIKFGHGTRSSIKKNIDGRCTVYPTSTQISDVFIDDFAVLYRITMSRNGAELCYKYNSDYFRRMFVMFRDSIDLFTVYDANSVIIAAATFIHDEHTAHYQFSGMDIEYAHLYPMERLISEACNHYQQQNKMLVHFGGGLIEGDSLHKFKRKFANLQLEYYTARGSV
jgi:hypothetical protein